MDKAYQVTFLPENIIITAAEGTNLLIAAKDAGIDIESPCGGRGTCGKCAVRIVSGFFGKCTDSHLTEEMSSQGYVLACKTKVLGDMVVEVPSFSRLARHKVLLDSKGNLLNDKTGYFSSNQMKPLCRKIQVRLDPPDLSDNMSDFDRLKAYLNREYGIKDTGISLCSLRKLPAVLRKGQWEAAVVLVETGSKLEIIDIEPGKIGRPAFGLAVDIGTTTVAINLIDLERGFIVDSAGTYNRQSVYGSDVISRIIYSEENPDGLKALQEAVVDTINELIGELFDRNKMDRNEVYIMVCAGNTVMTHLFMAVSPTWLRLEPYIPAAVSFPEVKAGAVGIDINPEATIITLPAVASYVGGDITAGVLATMLSRSEKLTLFIDIGTNGELVLGNNEWMVTCACSAGPAFEGSGISCGMRAMDGAIDRVDIDTKTMVPKCSTIGSSRPSGICGSGMIQALSEMKEAGIIDRAGKLLDRAGCNYIRKGNEGLEYILIPVEHSSSNQDIVITESDIKNLLRAKGAIFAGIRSMLQLVHLDIDAIERVYIAGGFGNYINITDAVNIGLLPDLPVEKYEYVGNSSLHGAVTVLLSKEALIEINEIAGKMTYLELSVGNRFMEEFISALFIPHTDLGLFPSVEKQAVRE